MMQRYLSSRAMRNDRARRYVIAERNARKRGRRARSRSHRYIDYVLGALRSVALARGSTSSEGNFELPSQRRETAAPLAQPGRVSTDTIIAHNLAGATLPRYAAADYPHYISRQHPCYSIKRDLDTTANVSRKHFRNAAIDGGGGRLSASPCVRVRVRVRVRANARNVCESQANATTLRRERERKSDR